MLPLKSHSRASLIVGGWTRFCRGIRQVGVQITPPGNIRPPMVSGSFPFLIVKFHGWRSWRCPAPASVPSTGPRLPSASKKPVGVAAGYGAVTRAAVARLPAPLVNRGGQVGLGLEIAPLEDGPRHPALAAVNERGGVGRTCRHCDAGEDGGVHEVAPTVMRPEIPTLA